MKKSTARLALLVFLAAPLALYQAQAANAAEAPAALLIQNATILTVTHGTIEHGSILIRDGKIVDVGASIKAPKDAQVVDAAGQFVIPGIIDCHSHIAVDGDVNEGSISVSSIVNIADVLNPDDISIYRDLAGGVTSANVLHGSANAIGGQTIVIKLRWGQPASKLPFEGALPGIKFALGENPKRSNFRIGRAARYPATRMGVEETIRGAFAEARDYKASWDAHNKRVSGGDKNATPPRRDLRLEPLVEVLEGKRYVHAHCYREDEILMLLRVAKEFGFKVRTFQHVLEGYKVADEIAAAGAGASTFSDWWAYKVEAYDAIPYNAALMTKRGVLVSINSDDSEEATHLNQEAAKSIKFGGLSHDEALKMVTINPAIQLGIDKRVGSIDPGKDADLVIYNRDPLSAYAVVQKTIIDGRIYFDRQRDIADRPAREKEKKELFEKEKKSEKKAEADKNAGEKKPEEKKPEQKKPEEGKPEEKTKTSASHRCFRGCAVKNVPIPRPNFLYLLGLLSLLYIPARTSAQDKSATYAVTHAKIFTLSGGTIDDGTLLIRDGKILAVGAAVAAPAGAQVIDAKGLQVYPGLFDPLTQMGLSEISAVPATVDATETGSFNPDVVAADAILPSSEHIPVTRAAGITEVLAVPASGGFDSFGDSGILGGQASAIHLAGWTISDLLLKKSVAAVLNWPEMQTQTFDFSTFSRKQKPYAEAKTEYEKQVHELTEWLDRARHYAVALGHGGAADYQRDVKLESLVPVTRGELPVLVFADRARDIRNAVEFCEKQKLKMILAGGAEAYKVKDLLRSKGIPVILRPTLTEPTDEDDPYDRPLSQPAELAAAGVKFAFGSFDNSFARRLGQQAANAVAHGLPYDEALKAVTLYPAQILGLSDQVGTLDSGKIANLIVTTGDPLELTTEVRYLFIKGQLTSLDNKHKSLYEKYLNRPKSQ